MPPPTEARVGGGGVGGVFEAVGGQQVVEGVENDAGLDACPFLVGIDFQEGVHVFGEV